MTQPRSVRRALVVLALAALLPVAPVLAQDDRPALKDGADQPAASWSVGDLVITAPFARATLPNAPVAGGFLTIANDGAQDDRLVAAASAIAGRVEIHEMAMAGDVMRMRELADGLPLPAGETVTLAPGGYHVMFMDLAGPLVEGEALEVTLTFERAGTITVPLAVGAPDASAAMAPRGGRPSHTTPSRDE